MAFTLAHPAAILPLRKLPFMALVPLVIGSMTPDVIGFLPYSLERHLPHSHSPAGTVLIDLPMGYFLLMLLLWFRHTLLQPLWAPHREIIGGGLNDFFTRPHRWLIAAPSLLVGSWTHIVWDRFTHESNWTYRNLPVLYQPLFSEASHQLPLYHFLQYSTSVIGLLYIGWQYHMTLKQSQAHRSPLLLLSDRKACLVLGLMITALLIGVIRLISARGKPETIYDQLSLILKTALICFALLYLMSGLLMARTGRRQVS